MKTRPRPMWRRMLGLNRFALSRQFHAETGLSLREYIAAPKHWPLAGGLDGR